MYIMITGKWKRYLFFFYDSNYLSVLQSDFQYYLLFSLLGLFILVWLVELSSMAVVWHPQEGWLRFHSRRTGQILVSVSSSTIQEFKGMLNSTQHNPKKQDRDVTSTESPTEHK